ncbi:MAG: hypothetical protein EA383_03575 [Spirochaetaceae bacterium]|nr:MAG: hypothetical protein EA383_03575 [Spirochaetaceae bacterium]
MRCKGGEMPMRQRKLVKETRSRCVFFIAALVLFLLSTPVFSDYAWEGIAARGAAALFPDEGLFVASNVVPRNSVVEVTSLDTGRSVRVIVTRRASEPGLLALLSPDAFDVLGVSADEDLTRVLLSPVSVPGLASADRDESLRVPDGADRVSTPGPISRPERIVIPAPEPEPEPAPTEEPEPEPETAPEPEPAVEVVDALPRSTPREDPAAPDDVDLPVELPEPDQSLSLPVPPAEPSFVLAELPEPDLRLVDPSPDTPAPEEFVAPDAFVDEIGIDQVNRLARVIERAESLRNRDPDRLSVAPFGERGPDDVARLLPDRESPPVFIADEPIVPIDEEPVITEPDEADASFPRIAAADDHTTEATDTPETPAFAEAGVERVQPTEIPPVVIADEPAEPRFVLDDLLDDRPLPPEEPEPDTAVVAEPPEPQPHEESPAEIAVDVIVEMEPAEPRPAEPGPAERDAAAIAEAEAEAAEVEETPPAVVAPVEAPEVVSDLPLVETLEPGSFYLQIGAWSRIESVEAVTRDLSDVYPLVITRVETEERTLYRVFVGPLGADERGLALFNIRTLGFRDAFVRRGGES